MVGQGRRHRLQRRVARGVPEPIVHGLELIHVEKHQGGRRAVALAEGQCTVQLAQKGPPVQHRGEGVAVSEQLGFVQPPLQPPHLGPQRLGFRPRGGELVAQVEIRQVVHGGRN